MKTFALTPMDAWFFRDGRPYNEKETNQADVVSLFPPPARTLSGALRAALARANGWSGNGPWTLELNRAFGSSHEDLGKLQFTGPFLIKKGKALWPLPRHLLGNAKEGRWTPAAFLGPDKKLTHCDSGEVNLPVIHQKSDIQTEGLKCAESSWITAPALSVLLNGILPHATEIFASNELWALEARVGLRRDETTHATGEGALYSPSYVRLHKGVSLGVGIAGVSNGLCAEVPALFPFGGESRLAQCDPWPHDPLPAPPASDSFIADTGGLIRFTVTLLTPGCLRVPEFNGIKVISACVGKPQFIGGWDSIHRTPLPLEPFAPAGSVWFCEASQNDFRAIHSQHGKHHGKHSSHGFGQIIIGHWPQTNP